MSDEVQTENIRPCPGCHSEKRKALGTKNDFRIFKCECGTLYTANIAAGEQREDYDAYYTEANLTTPAFIRERLKEIIADFEPHRKTGELLDIGFGAGDVLVVAREMGWTVSGVEVSAPAVEHAKKMGLDVKYGDLNSAGYPDNHFDVVTASEILEHCDDPSDLINEVYRILRPGGLFWATTPAATGLSFRIMGLDWTMLYPPEHQQLYSRSAAYKLFSKFSRTRILTHAFNPSEVIAYFKKNEEDSFDRVLAGYAINEKLSGSPGRKFIKTAVNSTLSALGMGDSLKIYAVK